MLFVKAIKDESCPTFSIASKTFCERIHTKACMEFICQSTSMKLSKAKFICESSLRSQLPMISEFRDLFIYGNSSKI